MLRKKNEQTQMIISYLFVLQRPSHAASVEFSMGGEIARYFGRYGSKGASKAVIIGGVPPFLLKTDELPCRLTPVFVFTNGELPMPWMFFIRCVT